MILDYLNPAKLIDMLREKSQASRYQSTEDNPDEHWEASRKVNLESSNKLFFWRETGNTFRMIMQGLIIGGVISVATQLIGWQVAAVLGVAAAALAIGASYIGHEVGVNTDFNINEAQVKLAARTQAKEIGKTIREELKQAIKEAAHEIGAERAKPKQSNAACYSNPTASTPLIEGSNSQYQGAVSQIDKQANI